MKVRFLLLQKVCTQKSKIVFKINYMKTKLSETIFDWDPPSPCGP